MATLQDILGGGLPAGLLSQVEQAQAEERAKNLGLLNLSLGLLQASRGAPGQGRPGLGQIIGQAGPIGVQAYQQSFDQTLQNALRGMQIQEMQRKQGEIERQRKARDVFAERMAALQGGVTTPSMALAGGGGPTQAAAERIGQPLSAADIARQQQAASLELLGQVAPEEVAKLAFREPRQLPTSIQEYNLAVNQGFKGTFQDFVIEQKKAGAPSTNITLPGDKKLGEVLGKGAAERLDNSFTQAQEAQSTLQNISELRPIIEQGVFAGPLSGAPRAIAQIATSLGITGKDTKEQLERTAVAMQGLAKFELSAAAAMRGQGAITENERMLIQRAAAGRLDQFTAPEVQALLNAMEKTANYRIGSHSRQLEVLRKNASPEVRDLLPLYELGPLNVMPTPTGRGVKRFNPATGRAE